MNERPISNNNNNRRHRHSRHRHKNNNGPKASQQNDQNQMTSGNPSSENNNNQQRRHNRNTHSNRPKNPNHSHNNNNTQGINIERIYEKYLNLLDQHLVARRKYHDLFYRADPAQKNKLERNFYNTLNEVRDFEEKLAPSARELFEKRNNGLSLDNIYTKNHEIEAIGETPPPETEWRDPHFLLSQEEAKYSNDKEESIGSIDDYLKYKNLA